MHKLISLLLIALKNGKVVGEGTPRNLLTPNFLRELYEVEARTYTDEDGRLHILFVPSV